MHVKLEVVIHKRESRRGFEMSTSWEQLVVERFSYAKQTMSSVTAITNENIRIPKRLAMQKAIPN